MVDDLLDFTASAEQLGKPVLSDLKEGKVTLPLIYAMENGHRDARELVARVLEEKDFISVKPETIVALVHESGALDRARSLAHDYARRVSLVEAIPEWVIRQRPDQVRERQSDWKHLLGLEAAA